MLAIAATNIMSCPGIHILCRFKTSVVELEMIYYFLDGFLLKLAPVVKGWLVVNTWCFLYLTTDVSPIIIFCVENISKLFTLKVNNRYLKSLNQI